MRGFNKFTLLVVLLLSLLLEFGDELLGVIKLRRIEPEPRGSSRLRNPAILPGIQCAFLPTSHLSTKGCHTE